METCVWSMSKHLQLWNGWSWNTFNMGICAWNTSITEHLLLSKWIERDLGGAETLSTYVKTCVWSMSVTEHLLSWNISTIIRNLFGCQRPQWVQLFRGSIDALVFKYCQIGKQNAISNAQILFERWIETFNYSARVIWKNIKTFRGWGTEIFSALFHLKQNLSQPVLCENAYIRTCGMKKHWNIPSQ